MKKHERDSQKCVGRFCDPLAVHDSPFVQMPYKLLALEHAASRLRPSKRWAVTEASVDVKDRYRLDACKPTNYHGHIGVQGHTRILCSI